MKNIFYLTIISMFLFSCEKRSKDLTKSTKDIYVEKTYFDSTRNLVKQETTFINNSIQNISAYSSSGLITDSLYKVEDKISIICNDENVSVGDTVTFIIKYDNPDFESQYLLLTDSIRVDDLFQYDNLISSENGVEIELNFLCRQRGVNYVNGIIFNTSIEVIEYINEIDFFGKRVGCFEEFNLKFTVAEFD